MVDFTTVCEHLRKAEDELIALIAQTEDFSEREQLLGFAKNVRLLSDRIGNATSTEHSKEAGNVTFAGPTPYIASIENFKITPEQKPFSSSLPVCTDAQLPTFFSNGIALYRFARLRDGSLYEKHVPIESLVVIVQLVCELLHSYGSVSTSGVIKAAEEADLQVREYHVQIALQALVFANVLATYRRGTYKTVEGVRPDVDRFMDTLISLPDQYRLSDRA